MIWEVKLKGFEKIIGHNDIKAYLDRVIDKDCLSSTYIFSGSKGLGKTEIAKIFAQNLQDNFADTNNDLTIIDGSDGSIGIDEVREKLVNNINIKPMANKYKVYIIKQADRLTQQAQNAILKSLEDAPEYVIIILVTSEERKLLPTIRSRAVTLKFVAPSLDEAVDYIVKEVGVDKECALMLAKLTSCNIGEAVRYSKLYQNKDIWNKIVHVLRHINDMSVYEIISFVKNLSKEEISMFMNMLQCFYKDILGYKISNDVNIIVLRDLREDVMKTVIISSYNSIYKAVDAIAKAVERIEANAGIDSVIEVLLFTIKEKNDGISSRS